ncbi:hypothetical protein [Thermostilla marina]
METLDAAAANLETAADAIGDLLVADATLFDPAANPGDPPTVHAARHAAAVRSAAADLAAWAAEIARKAVSEALGRDVAGDYAAAWIAAEMARTGYYFAADTASVILTPSTTGDAILFASDLDADGFSRAYLNASTIAGAYRADTGRLDLNGDPPAGVLSTAWPRGWPGGAAWLIPQPLTAGRIPSGFAFDAYGLPADWITDGETLLGAAAAAEWAITFSGTPTGGWWAIRHTTAAGAAFETARLGPTATAGAVQSALRACDELAEITVTGSVAAGFTVSFAEIRGDAGPLSAVDNLSGATVTIAASRPAEPGYYLGPTLRITGDGSTDFGIYYPLGTAFAAELLGLSIILRGDAGISGGLEAGIYESPSAASAVTDAAGNPSRVTLDLAAIGTDFYRLTGALRTVADRAAYFGIRSTAPVAAGKRLWIARPQLLAPSWDHPSTPALWFVDGRDGPADGDHWTITTTPAGTAKCLRFWRRTFGDSAATPPLSGTTLIPDSIIAS